MTRLGMILCYHRAIALVLSCGSPGLLNLERIAAATLRSDPFPYTVVENALAVGELAELIRDFPAIDFAGSVPVSEVAYGPAFQRLLDDIDGPGLRAVISEKFAIDLTGKPVMTTVRGVMREKDGRIHTDSKTKLITILIYFNEDWDAGGGHLRILRNGSDLDDYVEEISPKLGNMVIFRVTDNCWHGHKPVVGKRLSIQVNYLTGTAVHGKHRFFHRLSARLKKLLG